MGIIYINFVYCFDDLCISYIMNCAPVGSYIICSLYMLYFLYSKFNNKVHWYASIEYMKIDQLVYPTIILQPIDRHFDNYLTNYGSKYQALRSRFLLQEPSPCWLSTYFVAMAGHSRIPKRYRASGVRPLSQSLSNRLLKRIHKLYITFYW